ncbi:hypothetical protein E4U21_004168 [Claviceps maximensis]|nr:hypothetical protein E4U21_004168 [Claviceps maximensis]
MPRLGDGPSCQLPSVSAGQRTEASNMKNMLLAGGPWATQGVVLSSISRWL